MENTKRPGNTLEYLPFLGEILLKGTAIKTDTAVIMHNDMAQKMGF